MNLKTFFNQSYKSYCIIEEIEYIPKNNKFFKNTPSNKINRLLSTYLNCSEIEIKKIII